MQRTPLPWGVLSGPSVVRCDGKGGGSWPPPSICHFHYANGELMPDAEANALFIARACNAHGELLAALKSALVYLGNDATDDSEEARAVRSTIQAALAKAAGQ